MICHSIPFFLTKSSQ